MYSLLTVIVLIGLTGCKSQEGRRPWNIFSRGCVTAPENGQACNAGCTTCEAQGNAGCNAANNAASDDNCVDPGRKARCRLLEGRLCRDRGGEEEAAPAAPQGPQTGTVAYPYYTTRGPRDFLAKNPGSIGP
jgi:hypothetical protein